MERLWSDLRFGLRMHATTPVVTAAIVGTLAIGICATAASVAITNAFFIRPLPIAEPDRAVRIYQYREGSTARYFPVSADEVREIRGLRHVFDDAVIEEPRPFIIGVPGSYERLWGERVSDRYFQVLGIRPALGRLFGPGDGERDAAVLGDDTWTRRFGRDPGVLGRELRIDGRLHRIIGVAPAGFRGTLLSFTSEVWIPGAPEPDNGFAMARLRDGMRIEQARAAVDDLARRLERDDPAANRGVRLAAFLETSGRVPPPFHESVLGFSALLVTTALLVTAVACANVAGVLLARAAARRGEIGIRRALGASRPRILGQLLAESVPLTAAAGALGIVLAYQVTRWLSAVTVPLARGAQLSLDLAIDGLVLGSSVAISILTGILFGLVPALDASRPNVVTAIQSSSHRAGSARSPARRWLLGAQVAVSMLLLACSGFFVQSLRQGSRVDLGFDPRNVVTTSVDIRARNGTQEANRRFWLDLLDDVRRLPETEAASVTARLPLELGVVVRSLAPDGFQPSSGQPWPAVEFAVVHGGYFETLGIPVVEGRDFDERERTLSSIIVNDVVARQFWPGASAVGRTVVDESGDRFEVVGVVRRSKYLSVGEEPKPYVYFPLQQAQPVVMTIVARGRGDTGAHLRAIAAAVRRADPTAPLYEAGELSRRVDTALAPTAGATGALGLVSLMALALTSLGLFGAVSHVAVRRTFEIGVRRALGASSRSVAWLVVGETVTTAGLGVACGLVVALAAARLLRTLLYDAQPTDLGVLGLAAAILVVVCAAAAAAPTIRAVRVDAAAALRHE